MPRVPATLYACLLGLCALVPHVAGKPRRPLRSRELCSPRGRSQRAEGAGHPGAPRRDGGARAADLRALPGSLPG